MTGAISSIGNAVGNTVSSVASAVTAPVVGLAKSTLSSVGDIVSAPGASKALSAIGQVGGSALGIPNLGGALSSFTDSSAISPAPNAAVPQVLVQSQPVPAGNNTMIYIAIAGAVAVLVIFLMMRKK